MTSMRLDCQYLFEYVIYFWTKKEMEGFNAVFYHQWLN